MRTKPKDRYLGLHRGEWTAGQRQQLGEHALQPGGDDPFCAKPHIFNWRVGSKGGVKIWATIKTRAFEGMGGCDVQKTKPRQNTFDGTAVHWYASTTRYSRKPCNMPITKPRQTFDPIQKACVDAEVPKWQDDAWYWSKGSDRLGLGLGAGEGQTAPSKIRSRLSATPATSSVASTIGWTAGWTGIWCWTGRAELLV